MGLKLFDIAHIFISLMCICKIWRPNRSPAAQNICAKTLIYVSEKEIGMYFETEKILFLYTKILIYDNKSYLK